MTRTGRWSKDLPTQLRARYELAAADPALIELSDDVAALEMLAAETLKRFDTGESGAAWKLCRRYFSELEAAMRGGNAEATGAALSALRSVIANGAADAMAKEEFVDLLERKSAIATREHKRQIDLQVMLPMAKAEMLFMALSSAVRNRVKDEPTMLLIQRDFDALLGVRGSAGGAGGGSAQEKIVGAVAEPAVGMAGAVADVESAIGPAAVDRPATDGDNESRDKESQPATPPDQSTSGD